MNSRIAGLRVASAVFGLMSVGQLIRLSLQLDVTVAGHPLPLWPSAFALVIVGGLCVWLWRLSMAGSSAADTPLK